MPLVMVAAIVVAGCPSAAADCVPACKERLDCLKGMGDPPPCRAYTCEMGLCGLTPEGSEGTQCEVDGAVGVCCAGKCAAGGC